MSKNRILETIYLLIRVALHNDYSGLKTILKENYNQLDWLEVFDISKSQGISAIILDAIHLIYKGKPDINLQIPTTLKLRWIALAQNIECTYTKQLKLSTELANTFDAENIPIFVLKGLALSTYYPNPNHRECGDLDCYLGGKYDIGNRILSQKGYKVDTQYYVHSHIDYKGLIVENHQFTQPIRGSQLYKKFDAHLRKLIQSESGSYIGNTKLIKPSSNFTALHLTSHGFRHFLTEGIKLRHILDWTLFLKAEQNNINWIEFYHWTDKMHMTRFADALTAISVNHFGLEITNPIIHTTSPYANRILKDTLFCNKSLFNKGYSAWKSRLAQVRNKVSFSWKYHKIYQKSIIVELAKSVSAFVFEKNPKL